MFVDQGPSQQQTGRSQQTAEVMPTPVSAVTSSMHVSESLPSGQLQPPHIGRCVEVHVHTYMMTTLKGYIHREWIICMGRSSIKPEVFLKRIHSVLPMCVDTCTYSTCQRLAIDFRKCPLRIPRIYRGRRY